MTQSLKRWAPVLLVVALALVFVNSDLMAQSGGGGGGGWYDSSWWDELLLAGMIIVEIIGVMALLIWM